MLATLPVTAWRDRRLIGHELSRPLRAVSLVLFAFFVVIDGLIVLTPETPAAAGQQTLNAWLGVWRLMGVQPVFLTFGVVEWWSNVLMFMPIGFLYAGCVQPGRRHWAVPIAAALSTAVEFTQLFVPDRVASISDVAANTFGALLGVLLLVALSRMSRRGPDLPVPRTG